MKTLLFILSLTITSQTFAGVSPVEAIGLTSAPTLFPLIGTSFLTAYTFTGTLSKEVNQVMKEGQDYNQTGILNGLLASKVNIIMDQNPEFSEAEAVDALMELAAQLMNE